MASRTIVVSRRRVLPTIGMILLVAASHATATFAAPPQSFARDDDGTIRIEMTPAAPDDPTRPHALLPRFAEQRNENAAVFYGQVAELGSQLSNTGAFDALRQPMDELATRVDLDALAGLPNGNVVFEFLSRAARCRHCDWQADLREESYSMILVPHIQQMRQFARLLTLRARLQVARGDFDGAEATLRDGLALARHVGSSAPMVNALVGTSIEEAMLDVLLERLGRREAPNLYWALAELPDPLFDRRVGLQAERTSFESKFEFVRHPDASHDAAWWTDQLRDVWSLARDMGDSSSSGPFGERFQGWEYHPESLSILAIRGYPIARRSLIEQGFDTAAVDAMPVAQVLLLHGYRQYRTVIELDYRTTLVPYHEARPLAALVAETFRDEMERGESLPLASRLRPNFDWTRMTEVRNRQARALLMLLEALRWYGAEHQGKLPATLADLSPIPVPIDPSTGQPFEYRLEGDRAIVTSSESLGTPSFRYEIRLVEGAE